MVIVCLFVCLFVCLIACLFVWFVWFVCLLVWFVCLFGLFVSLFVWFACCFFIVWCGEATAEARCSDEVARLCAHAYAILRTTESDTPATRVCETAR